MYYMNDIKLKTTNMVDLSKIIKSDGVLPVFYHGFKAVISHDSNYNCYHIIIVDVSSGKFCHCYPISMIFDEIEIERGLIPRKRDKPLMWKYLINTDNSYEPDF